MNKTVESSALHAEIVGMLYANNRRSLMAAIVVMIALLLVQRPLINPVILSVWSGIFLIAYGARGFLTYQYEKDSQHAQHSMLWLQWFRASTGFCGIAWGLAGILLFPDNDTAHQAFLIFALVGVSGAGIIIYSVDTFSSNLFSGGIVLFMIPRFLIHGSSVSLALAVLFVVYVVYVTVAGRSLALSLRENISLRIASNLDNQKVHQLAYYDFLTGLPNRRLLTDRLNQAFARCVQHQSYGAVLSLDLNNFKGLNDSKGHQAGDELLQQVAMRLQACLRKKDTIARMGGDEFVVISARENASRDYVELAGRLIEAISRPLLHEGHECRVGSSIGIATRSSADARIEQVLVNADIALYEAKRRGRNRVECFTDALRLEVVNTKRTADEILRGLEQNEFMAYFQPQFDARTLEIVGLEALARWDHPSKGILAPTAFLSIAESLKVVSQIDAIVLNQALLQQFRLSAGGHPIPKISVNVSAQRLMDETLFERLENLSFRPGSLSFELLESISFDGDDRELHLARLDLLADIFGGAPDHQPGHEHGENGIDEHAVEPRADAADHDLAKLDVEHRHQPAQRHEAVMHTDHRTAGGGGGDDGEQSRGRDAEADFLALHIE